MAPAMEVECVVEDKRPARDQGQHSSASAASSLLAPAREQHLQPCLSDGCPFMAHPRPSEHDIELGYCCNKCYGRSTNQEWVGKKGGGQHYKNCFSKMAEHPPIATTAAAPSRRRGKRRRSSVAMVEAFQVGVEAAPEPVEPESGSEDCMEDVASMDLSVFCPTCKGSTRMAWTSRYDGAYREGWTCDNYQKCGVQYARSANYDQPNRPRFHCSKCNSDVCAACSEGLRRDVVAAAGP